MKLLIGIPTGGRPTRPFLDALAALRLPAGIDDADRLVWTGNLVAVQREMIARAAVAQQADYLVMIDDDIVAPPDALERLIGLLAATPAAAVAGALYYSRDSARPMVVANWNSADTTSASIPAFSSTAPARVDGIGFGCVALRVAALQALPRPYFASHVFVDERARHVTQCDEDYLLCERLRAAGHEVYVDGGLRAGHYDRGNDTIAPARWETDDATSRRRMIVRETGGVSLVPFNDDAPRAREQHEPFAVTLIRVDGDD